MGVINANDEIDRMIIAAGKTGPRVTAEMIRAKIDSEMYLRTPEQGLTVCKIQLKNGFVFIGHSACVDPANYDKEIGDKIAFDNAFRQIWSHEGYLLKEIQYGLVRLNAERTQPPAADEPDDDLQASLGNKPHD